MHSVQASAQHRSRFMPYPLRGLIEVRVKRASLASDHENSFTEDRVGGRSDPRVRLIKPATRIASSDTRKTRHTGKAWSDIGSGDDPSSSASNSFGRKKSRGT